MLRFACIKQVAWTPSDCILISVLFKLVSDTWSYYTCKADLVLVKCASGVLKNCSHLVLPTWNAPTLVFVFQRWFGVIFFIQAHKTRKSTIQKLLPYSCEIRAFSAHLMWSVQKNIIGNKTLCWLRFPQSMSLNIGKWIEASQLRNIVESELRRWAKINCVSYPSWCLLYYSKTASYLTKVLF